ncbi:MAG: hypothetical protein PHD29_04495 [bacterium]|nr:hypothetical protein [bacterium]MDD5354317.1 hypothetical protein [bacterium]MDD5756520.1 hypothetical protein [bacterium]
MSYDIDIHYDENHSKSLPKDEIKKFLQNRFQPMSEDATGLSYWPEPDQQIQFYLGHGDEEKDFINNISICVPYPCFERLGDKVFDVCFIIAEHLGWQVFDNQLGKYIKREDKEIIKDTSAKSLNLFHSLSGQLAKQSSFSKHFKKRLITTKLVIPLAMFLLGCCLISMLDISVKKQVLMVILIVLSVIVFLPVYLLAKRLFLKRNK